MKSSLNSSSHFHQSHFILLHISKKVNKDTYVGQSGIHYTQIEGNLPLTGHVKASRKDLFQGSDYLST